MCAVLEMAADQWEDDDVPILRGEFQAHVEMVFEELVVEAIFKKNES